MTGREYQGPGSKVMHMCAKNVPKQSMGNVKFAWRHAFNRQADAFYNLETVRACKLKEGMVDPGTKESCETDRTS